jgi:hypothetical protein
MHLALSLSASYHTGVDYWVNLPVVDLYAWAAVAKEIAQEANAANQGQQI